MVTNEKYVNYVAKDLLDKSLLLQPGGGFNSNLIAGILSKTKQTLIHLPWFSGYFPTETVSRFFGADNIDKRFIKLCYESYGVEKYPILKQVWEKHVSDITLKYYL